MSYRCNAKRVADGYLFDKGAGPVAVGIDQSYTGFAVTALSQNGYYHSWLYQLKGQGAGRLLDGQAFLFAVFTVLDDAGFPVERVAMEGYAPGAKFGREMAGELGGAVKLALHTRGHQPLIVAPTAVKKFATGKGTAVKKQQMLLAVYKGWGVEFDDDNMCDSFVIAHIASGTAQYKYQQEVLAKVMAA